MACADTKNRKEKGQALLRDRDALIVQVVVSINCCFFCFVFPPVGPTVDMKSLHTGLNARYLAYIVRGCQVKMNHSRLFPPLMRPIMCITQMILGGGGVKSVQ